MKKILLLLSSLLCVSVAQAKITLITDTKAYMTLCPAQAAGCAKRIVVNGKPYLVSVPEGLTDVQELVEAIEGSYGFHKITKTQPFTVRGYAKREKGHFPNPGATFDVFTIVSLKNVVLPK